MPNDLLLAVTAIGRDRPGIVAGVTKVLLDHGCNLEDATSTILRGHFSMMLLVRTATASGDLQTALAAEAERLQLVVTVSPVDPAVAKVDAPTHMVSVYGADRPGIVHAVAQVLQDSGTNITDLTSRVIGEGSAPVYALMLEVVVAEGVDLEADLERVKSELGVDVSVHPIDPGLF